MSDSDFTSIALQVADEGSATATVEVGGQRHQLRFLKPSRPTALAPRTIPTSPRIQMVSATASAPFSIPPHLLRSSWFKCSPPSTATPDPSSQVLRLDFGSSCKSPVPTNWIGKALSPSSPMTKTICFEHRPDHQARIHSEYQYYEKMIRMVNFN